MNFRLISPGAAFCLLFSSLNGVVSVERPTLTYNHVVGAHDELYVASTVIPDNASMSLARLALTRTGDDHSTIQFGDLVPSRAIVNGARSMSANPLYESPIRLLAAYKNFALVGHGVEDAVHSVALIQDKVAGSALLTNTKSFGDALGAVTQNITCLAGGIPSQFNQGFVFAAVSPSDEPTCAGQPAAGIGIAQVLPYGIVPFDCSGNKGGPCAAQLSDEMMQINGVGSISAVTSMCWNAVLNKLYVGLRMEDGGVAVAVGSVSIPGTSKITGEFVPNISFSLSPILSVIGWQDEDFIVAHPDAGIEIEQLDVLNASTGKNYLVVSRDTDRVYAVPLVSDAQSVSFGLLAQRQALATPANIASVDQLYTTQSSAAVVGGGAAPASILALSVLGDSVCVSCDGNDDATRGVFISQPLFTVDGVIRGWTPWEMMMSSGTAVSGFVRDAQARIKYLGNNHTTLYSMLWGQSSANGLWGGLADNTSVGLLQHINTFFPAAHGGVQSVHSVVAAGDDARWGHTSPYLADGNALLMLTGRNRCALALTAVDGSIINQDAFDGGEYYAQYDLSNAGINIGVVTAAALSRGVDGWMFVGGTAGLAVLSHDDGDGCGTLVTLSDLNDMSFKELRKPDGSAFEYVRHIMTDENAFYVVCLEGVYRCEYDASSYTLLDAAPLDCRLIASSAALCGSARETILSALIEGDFLFLATTRGLWVNNALLETVENTVGVDGWGMISLTAGQDHSFGVCAQLSFQHGVTTNRGGTLMVLAADVALNVASVYRVDVATAEYDAPIAAGLGAVEHTTDNTRSYMTLLGQLREYFYTDGSSMIDASSLHHRFTQEGSGTIRILPVSPRIGAIDAWSDSVQPVFGESVTINTLTGIVRDRATGTIIVPGAWGVQVLQ